MARARSIKPGFFKNESLTELPPHARLLFIGLWTIADRDGRLEDRPKRIKAEIFPYENVNVDKLLTQLSESGFIVRYEALGGSYIAIPTWSKHQKPHIKEAASSFPPPPGQCSAPTQVGANNDPSTTKAMSRMPDSLNPEPLTLNPTPSTQSFGGVVEFVRSRFPATDDRLLSRIISEAQQVCPEIEDWQLVKALERSGTKNQESAAYYLKTVPQVVKSWLQN